jgi:hypothetical protein
MSEWYVAAKGQVMGPATIETVLAYLRIRSRAETYVWREGFNHWLLAKDVPELLADLSVKPTTDLAQYGVADYWSAPLATLTTGAGDCEDYAILKYVALLEVGIDADDLQFMLVHDIKHNTIHAVLVVRLGEEWIILDNQMLIMLNVVEARHYYPLFVLNHRGVRDAVSTAFHTLKSGSGG